MTSLHDCVLGSAAFAQLWLICMTTNAATRTSSHTTSSSVGPSMLMSVYNPADTVEIEGDNIMLADFGTAFDWTKSASDVTDGVPDAHTRLYVAPEVSGSPKDRWSEAYKGAYRSDKSDLEIHHPTCGRWGAYCLRWPYDIQSPVRNLLMFLDCACGILASSENRLL